MNISMRYPCMSLGCGSQSSILITRRGTLWGGGQTVNGSAPDATAGGVCNTPTYIDLTELESFDLTAVAAGKEHVLAVTDSGVLLAWASSNTDGQAGVGAEHARAAPVLPRTPTWPAQVLRCAARIATVACGDSHSLALTESGEIYAFGSNSFGQLGVGSKVTSSASPMLVGGRARGVPFRAVVAGASHSMALTVSGAVFSWGSNVDGLLGHGPARVQQRTVASPGLVSGLSGPAVHIAAGGTHSGAIVRRGRLFLAGSNSHGQLGLPRSELTCSYRFQEVLRPRRLHARSVALGYAHTVILTFSGELHAFGRNSEGQCGTISNGGADACVEEPVRISFPTTAARDTSQSMVVWAVAAGRNHNLVLCSKCPDRAELTPKEPVEAIKPEREKYNTGQGATSSRPVQFSPSRILSAQGHVVRKGARRATGEFNVESKLKGTAKKSVDCEDLDVSDDKKLPSLSWFRPIVQPGAAPRTFTTLSVGGFASLLSEASCGLREAAAQAELKRVLTTIFAKPAMLNASFCYPGLRTARLDAAGLCRLLSTACSRIEGLGQALLEAATEGVNTLAVGSLEDLVQRDQLRAIVIYMCLPAQKAPQAPAPTAGGRTARPPRSLLSTIAHLTMRMSGAGRRTLRDLIADECGDVRVLRDFIVANVRTLADDTIRNAGVQPWLAGPLWEVVSQLQLQRPLWESIFLLQVLSSAADHATRLVRPSSSASTLPAVSGTPLLQTQTTTLERPEQALSLATDPLSELAVDVAELTTNSIARSGIEPPARAGLLEPSVFHLKSLADNFIPPEVEFWLFQEHAQFHLITPAEVVEEPLWADAAGMLPRRFCSFMAHANLVPIAFKQRVLHVENVLRQRLSQEQVLWPQADAPLNTGRTNAAAFYFILSVSRRNLLRDTFSQMYSASPVDLRRPLRVEFRGEEAVDEGGVMREFFRLLSQELFAPSAGLFFEVEDSRRLWFSPVLLPGRQLEDYWMVGVIVALAVYNNHPGLDAPLPNALFKKLKDQSTSQEDLMQLFPSHARSLEAILTWAPSRPADTPDGLSAADEEFKDIFCLTFSLSPPAPDAAQQAAAVAAWAKGSTSRRGAASGSAGSKEPDGKAQKEMLQRLTCLETPLCEGGCDRPVLYRDREEFARLAHKYLLHSSVQAQFESFARGFRRVCNSPLFDVLGPDELESIVAGNSDVDIARLRQGAQYEGFTADEPFIQSFWQVLDGFSVTRQRRFLAFCTGSDVAPATGLQDLRLLVQRNGDEPTMRFSAHYFCVFLHLVLRTLTTCIVFRAVGLPSHFSGFVSSSKEFFKRYYLLALSNGPSSFRCVTSRT
eukprot:TRINITY_DN58275_c0_g2_i1.p1 TRINITY_DN58275_c0_g2~~TRINITY_DN58275_c0_g2_i1.p1  ORF type:complete len:1321 (-),score=157.79 TRINITY_DN58275_c0_g2_i1:377-4339(-)